MTAVSQKKARAAAASIAASGLLTLGKLVAGLLSGSLALLSEAGHGLLDTGATTLTFFAIRWADKPADEEHQYGHGKIEAVAALAEAGFLLVLAVGVFIEATRRLAGHPAEPVEAGWPVFAVLIVAILVDSVRFLSLSKIAKETRSDALAADALHFASDLMASIVVLVGLVATHFNYREGDSLAAIGVALFIAFAAFRLARRTIDTLVDTAPEGLSMRVRELVKEVPGVVGIEALRLRSAGAQVQGELSIAVPRTMPLELVTGVKQEVEAALAAVPELAVTIIANPRAVDNETVLERVLVTAAHQRVPIHHVTVQQIDDRKSVSFDAELDGHMRLGAAHEIASRLESAILAELGPEIEVESHIEPLEVRELSGQEAGAGLTGEIAAGLARRAAEGGVIGEIHDVRVRQTPMGLVVNYHCHVDPDLSVNEVHAQVDQLDRKVRADFAAITRIVGHAEPRRG